MNKVLRGSEDQSFGREVLCVFFELVDLVVLVLYEFILYFQLVFNRVQHIASLTFAFIFLDEFQTIIKLLLS
jgi:hypothetical protein